MCIIVVYYSWWLSNLFIFFYYYYYFTSESINEVHVSSHWSNFLRTRNLFKCRDINTYFEVPDNKYWHLFGKKRKVLNLYRYFLNLLRTKYLTWNWTVGFTIRITNNCEKEFIPFKCEVSININIYPSNICIISKIIDIFYVVGITHVQIN